MGLVTKVLDPSPDVPDETRYVVDVGHHAKYVTRLAPHLSPTDVDEGTRVGLDRRDYRIQIPLPARLEACVSMMEVVKRVDSGYDNVGGCEEQLRAIREVVELPLLHPERFARLGLEPPKGALLFGPPGGGKTLCARAVAASTSATFVRVVGASWRKNTSGRARTSSARFSRWRGVHPRACSSSTRSTRSEARDTAETRETTWR